MLPNRFSGTDFKDLQVENVLLNISAAGSPLMLANKSAGIDVIPVLANVRSNMDVASGLLVIFVNRFPGIICSFEQPSKV
jgi:hypothetical protein